MECVRLLTVSLICCYFVYIRCCGIRFQLHLQYRYLRIYQGGLSRATSSSLALVMQF
jgi:hypothetical protein